jgi:hypothetical protein
VDADAYYTASHEYVHEPTNFANLIRGG